jgi:hypothetical protein
MPLRNGRPITFRAAGLSDAVDGTNAFPGAMKQLVNLIPDPSTDKVWVPRPAAVQKCNYSTLSTPGFVSSLLVVGDTAVGTVASARNPGYDEPFAYNLLTGMFLPIAGILPGNVPLSPPSSGAWTPPIIAQVGSRVMLTHPGFPGGAVKIGWFDISGAKITTFGSIAIDSRVITGFPNILGVQPGMTITGPYILPGNTVVSTAAYVNTCNVTSNSNNQLTGVQNLAGLALGQTISTNPTLGIPAGTVVISIDIRNETVSMSNAATHSATGLVTFTGASITMAQPAIGNQPLAPLTIAGGTRIAPLWGAGDTNPNPLPSQPVGVAQFNGRAYFACGTDGIVFSDSLLPCQVSNTNGVQALTTNDGLAVTALGPLMEFSALTGGIVQGLIAFEGVAKMQQITGDPTTGNLSMNALPVATGTLSPLSIVPCELGLAFMSPQGLRIINFAGQVEAPIGDRGAGVAAPFVAALVPARICAAASSGIIRISVASGLVGGQPTQEFWYDLARKSWSGPHSFAASLIQAWGASFLMAPVNVTASLWQSDPRPNNTSVYVENGSAMTWAWQTCLQPDNAAMAMNTVVTMSFAMGFAPLTDPVTIQALDENGNQITGANGTIAAQTTISNTDGSATNWGQFNWNQADWGGAGFALKERSVSWPCELVFKQMSILATGISSYPTRIGNLYARVQPLGYNLPEA